MWKGTDVDRTLTPSTLLSTQDGLSRHHSFSLIFPGIKDTGSWEPKSDMWIGTQSEGPFLFSSPVHPNGGKVAGIASEMTQVGD